jgi:hypothetical protein
MLRTGKSRIGNRFCDRRSAIFAVALALWAVPARSDDDLSDRLTDQILQMHKLASATTTL